jgi:hypothetical protein
MHFKYCTAASCGFTYENAFSFANSAASLLEAFVAIIVHVIECLGLFSVLECQVKATSCVNAMLDQERPAQVLLALWASCACVQAGQHVIFMSVSASPSNTPVAQNVCDGRHVCDAGFGHMARHVALRMMPHV